MDIREYFDGKKKGFGVLATADAEGKVDLAVFASPHILGEDEVGFIMPERLTHHNLQSNPHAAYMFMEQGDGANGEAEKKWQGRRLFLTKTAEEKDTERLYAMRRVDYGDDRDGRYLVSFKVNKVLPLTGTGAKK